MALNLIESRIDKKGRVYLSSKIRKMDFFQQKIFRLLPITRTSTKQIERGLLLVSPSDEFDATYFWGNYDMKKRYTIGYDPRGRLATTENIMKNLGLHPFAYKYVFLVRSCFGWELWPKHRLKRILRTIRVYKIKIIEPTNMENIPVGAWFDAQLDEKFLFSKEAGKSLFLRAVNKSTKTKKEKSLFLLEKINGVRLLIGGTMKDIRKEVSFFIKSTGYYFALPFLDTEDRIVPSGFVRMSYWESKDIIRLTMQRIRDLSTAEISERVTSYYTLFSYEKAKKFINRGQLLRRPFNIDYSEPCFTFWRINVNEKNFDDKSFKTFQLVSKNADVYFNKNSHTNIAREFYKC